MSEPMATPNTLSLDERIAKAMKSGTDFDALVGQVVYETSISTPAARKKVRRIKEQLKSG